MKHNIKAGALVAHGTIAKTVFGNHKVGAHFFITGIYIIKNRYFDKYGVQTS
ncbi:hypothetical protein D3C87_1802740 [compost metagenome]